MTEVKQPAVRPARPFFSSGPCAKRPGWTPEALNSALVGRSHRSKPGKAKLKDAIEKTRKILGIPANYRIGIMPASDTGAMEMAMWSLLGPLEIDIFVQFSTSLLFDHSQDVTFAYRRLPLWQKMAALSKFRN